MAATEVLEQGKYGGDCHVEMYSHRSCSAVKDNYQSPSCPQVENTDRQNLEGICDFHFRSDHILLKVMQYGTPK